MIDCGCSDHTPTGLSHPREGARLTPGASCLRWVPPSAQRRGRVPLPKPAASPRGRRLRPPPAGPYRARSPLAWRTRSLNTKEVTTSPTLH